MNIHSKSSLEKVSIREDQYLLWPRLWQERRNVDEVAVTIVFGDNDVKSRWRWQRLSISTQSVIHTICCSSYFTEFDHSYPGEL